MVLVFSCAKWRQRFWIVVPVAWLVVAVICSTGNALFIEPSPSDTIVATSGNNAFFGPFNLGFSFPYFGISQTSVFMNTNGSLSFGGGSVTATNVGFPAVEPIRRVAVIWDDLLVSPGRLRKNALTPGQFVAIWELVGIFGEPGSVTAEIVLLGPGNTFGAPNGTVVFSYDDVTNTSGTVTVGLNKGNGVNFATLASILGTTADGTLSEIEATELLPSKTFTFTPTSDSTYTVNVGGPGGAPTVTLALTGCTTCEPEDTFSVEATFRNPSSETVRVEIKAGVVFPEGVELNIWLIPDKHFEFTFPPGFDLTVEILNAAIPNGLPTGTWAYEVALISPELGRTIFRDVKAFTVQ